MRNEADFSCDPSPLIHSTNEYLWDVAYVHGTSLTAEYKQDPAPDIKVLEIEPLIIFILLLTNLPCARHWTENVTRPN